MTASATSLVAAPALIAVSVNRAAQQLIVRRIFMVIALSASSGRLQIFESSGAVADLVHVNVEPVENAQQQVPGRPRLFEIQFRVGEMTIALQLSVGAPDEDVWYIVVSMLIRVPHVRAIKYEGMI